MAGDELQPDALLGRRATGAPPCRRLRGALLMVGLLAAGGAGAVCIDPQTGLSGYRMPVAAEVEAADLIVIGKVVKVEPRQEDLGDPAGITGYLYTVRVQRRLKGAWAGAVTIHDENDSSRYAMGAGEVHLLFLNREGSAYVVNSCGNSSALPGAGDLVNQVKTALGKRVPLP